MLTLSQAGTGPHTKDSPKAMISTMEKQLLTILRTFSRNPILSYTTRNIEGIRKNRPPGIT
jgi:hypothetical protein